MIVVGIYSHGSCDEGTAYINIRFVNIIHTYNCYIKHTNILKDSKIRDYKGGDVINVNVAETIIL